MSSPAQRKATQNYRNRRAQLGIIRFEVQAPESDRALLRALAHRLAEDGAEAEQARLAVQKILAGKKPKVANAPPMSHNPARTESQPAFGDLFASGPKAID